MKEKNIEVLILGIMCFILTIAIVVQIKTVNNNGITISRNQRESDLKTQVLRMKEKYEAQYEEYEKIEKELEKIREQATGNNEELQKLENKIKKYNVLLGNTDVSGQGVMITLSDGKNNMQVLKPSDLIIHDRNVRSVIYELKNAGAEAISINNQRVVNPTAITCDGNVIVVNGTKISSPVQISAIGLLEVLSTLNRPGGTLEEFVTSGKGVEFKKNAKISIPKYTGVYTFKYAKTVD